MSNLLDYRSFLIDIGATAVQWKDEFKLALTDNNWQIIRDMGSYIDVEPPAAQNTGVTEGRSFLRVEFTDTTVTFEPKVAFNVTQASTWHVLNTIDTTSTSSAYASSLTIDGVTWSGTNPGGATSRDARNNRTQSLYDAIVADANSYPTGRDAYTYTLNQSADPWRIEFTRNDPSTEASPLNFTGNPYTTTAMLQHSLSPNIPVPYESGDKRFTITIDLSSGFIYFLSIFERAIVLATKTTTAYYGPIAAVWIDNSLALQQTPTGMVPAELFVFDAGNRNGGSNRFDGKTTHGIGYYQTTFNDYLTPFNAHGNYSDGEAFTLPYGTRSVSDLGELKHILPRDNRSSAGPAYGLWAYAYAGGVNAYYDDLLAPVFPIINMEIFRAHNTGTGNGYFAVESPSSFIEEVFMFHPTATNESLHLARIVDVTTNATTAATDTATMVEVADTSLFPPSGTIIVNNEIIEYTSKTATSFGGLTRGKYGTAASAIATTDTIYASRWFVKINSGALLAGTTKPTVGA